jgi:hypothetical protein
VLAIAILGIVMVKAFASHLNSSLAHLMLPSSVLAELRAGQNKLAGLQVPSGLSPSMKADVNVAIQQAFVFGFRAVMLICAALSLGSAAVAWFLIPRDRPHPKLNATVST